MRHQSSLPQNKNEKLIVNALIKVVFVFQLPAKLFRYSQRNVAALADNEIKTERESSYALTHSPSVLGFTT